MNFFVLSFVFSVVYGEIKEADVYLPTAALTSKINVNMPSCAKSHLSLSYAEKLRSVLIDDFYNHGGFSIVKEKKNISFLINISVVDSEILVSIDSKKFLWNKKLKPKKLSDAYLKDRMVIHKIFDELIKIITGTPGIASSRILYAVKFSKNPKSGSKPMWESEIWESDYDGHNARQITFENSYCITPACFNINGGLNKDKFIYVNYKMGQSKIYIGNFHNRVGKELIQLRGNQLLPSISQNNDLIAFISDASGRADLFIQPFSCKNGAVGKSRQVFSFPKSVQSSPSFRPDGKKIAFVSDKDGSPKIFLIDTPTSNTNKMANPICITKKHKQSTCPSWSPDGSKLAYSAMIDGNRQIMVYDFLSMEEIQLTHGKQNKENPNWSPNNLHIIFNTTEPDSSELFLIGLKEKRAIQITNGPGIKHYPVWKPN